MALEGFSSFRGFINQDHDFWGVTILATLLIESVGIVTIDRGYGTSKRQNYLAPKDQNL